MPPPKTYTPSKYNTQRKWESGPPPSRHYPKIQSNDNVRLKDLRPVGEFFADYQKRTVSVQPNAIRRLNKSLIKEGGHTVNLEKGLEEFVEREEFKNKLFPMLCFLKLSETCYGQTAVNEPGEIVCTRTSLVQIASSAYSSENYEDARFDDGFLLVLFKRGGSYFICEYSTPTKKSKDTGHNPTMYAGIKFENYLTLEEGQTKPDLDCVASSAQSYCAVFKASLVDTKSKTTHKLFYPAKIDCVSNDGRYTEIKYRTHNMGMGRSWWRIEMTWYLQCYFADIKRIAVGFSNKEGGVSKVKDIGLDSLDYAKGRQWDLGGCLDYLNKFLTDIKSKLETAEEETYFYAFRSPNQTNYVITTYSP